MACNQRLLNGVPPDHGCGNMRWDISGKYLEARPEGLEGAIKGKHDLAAVHLNINVPPFKAGVLVDAAVTLRKHARISHE